jgi:hypothetical protein
MEFVTQTGAAMAAADDDYFYADTAMTGGSDQNITGSLAQTIAAAARSVTATMTDADSSVTALVVYLTGYDIQGRVIQETLTFAGTGTETVESNYAFRELTSVIYHADGTIGGTDNLKIGFGNTLGVPMDFNALTDIERARVDATNYEDISSGAGTWNTTYNTWEPLVGVIPNASRRYYIQASVD